MASVWVARQSGKHGFQKLVAIKTILPKFAADVRFQEMFLDEARIASRIDHPNVAHILDLGEENEILYLVMEYVDGDALSKLNRACQKKGAKIPTGVVLRILADACAGLHEAHELRDSDNHPLDIVHRDVSPHNILVSAKGTAKLIDFGIAKARSRAGSDTNSGVLKGKIQYMAPEQAAGGDVDRRSDLWAVGAILYHMMAGKPPYEGDNQLATLHLLGSGRPPVPLPPSVHPSISGIVRKALLHDPNKRFATAAEMRDTIERAMVDAKVSTSSAEVAQFCAQHMSERAARRRQAIDYAIAAASDRRRVAEMLRTGNERPSGSNSVPPAPMAAPAKSFDPLSSSSDFPAAPAAPLASPTSDAVARLTPRVSEPPPSPSKVSSYATLGSAALDASARMPFAGQTRKSPLPLVVGGIAAALAVAAVSVVVLRPSAADPPAPAARIETTAAAAAPGNAQAAAPRDGVSAPSAAAATAGAAPAASSAPTATSAALAKPAAAPAKPATPAYVPPQRWVPPSAPPPKLKPTKTIDDGF